MKLTSLKPRLSSLVTQRVPSAPAGASRMRGRAAVDRRAGYLRLHPICSWCTKQDRTRVAEVVDHVTPLWAGGEDDYEANGQALCHEDHDAKTACEARMRAAGGWLATPCQCGMHAQAGS